MDMSYASGRSHGRTSLSIHRVHPKCGSFLTTYLWREIAYELGVGATTVRRVVEEAERR